MQDCSGVLLFCCSPQRGWLEMTERLSFDGSWRSSGGLPCRRSHREKDGVPLSQSNFCCISRVWRWQTDWQTLVFLACGGAPSSLRSFIRLVSVSRVGPGVSFLSASFLSLWFRSVSSLHASFLGCCAGQLLLSPPRVGVADCQEFSLWSCCSVSISLSRCSWLPHRRLSETWLLHWWSLMLIVFSYIIAKTYLLMIIFGTISGLWFCLVLL